MIRHHLLIAALCLVTRPVLGETASPTSPERTLAEQGERIRIEDKGFSIIPPAGWEIRRNVRGLSLVFQAPKVAGDTYQKSIQVRYGQRVYAIDHITADEYARTLVENRSRVIPGEGYRLRNKLPVELANGTKGLLFYTEFSFGDLPMMELHILVSSEKGHFLMTYTDIAENFESDAEGGWLDIAYESMRSARVGDQVGSRFGFLGRVGVFVGILLLLLVIYKLWQSRRTVAYEHELEADDDDEDEIVEVSSDLERVREQTSVEAKELDARVSEMEASQHFSEDKWEDDDDDGVTSGFDEFDNAS